MKVTVCIGSSCHIKGSRQVVEQLQYLISENKLGDKVVDGGVDLVTCRTCKENGADVLVAGSAFYKAADRVAFAKEIEA